MMIKLDTPSEEVEIESEPFARTNGYLTRKYFEGMLGWEERSYIFGGEIYSPKEHEGARGLREGVDYNDILTLINQGYQVLSPMELSFLMKRMTTLDDNQRNIWFNQYGTYPDSKGAPYWSSQGMGFVQDLNGKFPEKYRGRFILATIKEANMEKGRVYPDFGNSLILDEDDIRYMAGYVKNWDIRTESGLAVPICGGKVDAKLGEIKLEDLMHGFSPIIVGAAGNGIRTASPRSLFGAWTRKVQQGLPSKIYQLRE